jgi:hypothetical protein
MSLNFPANPTLNQTYTVGDKTWVFNGVSWNAATQTSVGVFLDVEPPTLPKNGDVWWDSTIGKMKVYYQDEDTSQWVDAVNTAGSVAIQLTDYIKSTDLTAILNSYITLSSFNTSIANYAPLASPLFTGVVGLPGILEKANMSTGAASANGTLDLDTAAVWYFSGANTANWTLNIRASSSVTLNSRMNIGQSVSIALLVTNTGSAFIPTPANIQIDGSTSNRTIRWQGGTAPSSGNANSIDTYTFTILKTANNTFIILAAQTRFG